MSLKSGTAYENQSFYIELYLNGPVVDPIEDRTFPQKQTLYISADVNFNGIIDDGESYEIESNSPGYTLVMFAAEDDGPWPGNGTPSDQITVNASFASDTDSLDVTIRNIPPLITSPLSISYYQNALGKTIARASVSFVEASHRDTHKLKVTWGDGTVTTTSVIEANEACSAHFSGFVEREVSPGVNLLPTTVDVSDDDTGTDSRSLLSHIDVAINNDDDNQNQRQDLFDRGFNDDDLKQISLSDLITSGMNPSTGTFSLHYDSGKMLLWTTQSKDALILPAGSNASNYIGIPTVPFNGQSTAWVEGLSPGVSDVYIQWTPNESSGDGCWDGSLEGNHRTIRVWGIDLDVDSDNNGIIEHSDWEEEIEDHEFAIGKLLNFLNAVPSTTPTPISIQLPAGLDPTVKLKLKGRVAEGGSTGRIQFTNSQNDFLGQTDFDGNIGEFPLSQLGYDSTTGEITIYAKAVNVAPIADTKQRVDQSGKPDNRIVASVVLDGLTVKDEVKFMLVRDYQAGTRLISDFYIHVNDLAHLRGAGVAQAVYENSSGSDSGKNFAMKRLSQDEVTQILDNDPMSTATAAERSRVRELILTYLFDVTFSPPFPGPPPGFQAALYRDYVTGGYRLSFRGTELNWDVANDWLDNIRQGLFGHSPQYEAAILLAWAVSKLDTCSGAGFSLAGHSLGGGMASAAAIANSIHADAFNGAGVHPHSLFRSDHVTPIIAGTNPNMANAGNLISHFYAEAQADTTLQKFDCPDILTWVSSRVALMPDPNGTLIPLEGLYNLDDDSKLRSLEAYFATLPSTLEELRGQLLEPEFLANMTVVLAFNHGLIALMINTHAMENIFFGLLHNDQSQWNAYDGGNPQNR
jgi:hypothetical protein